MRAIFQETVELSSVRQVSKWKVSIRFWLIFSRTPKRGGGFMGPSIYVCVQIVFLTAMKQ